MQLLICSCGPIGANMIFAAADGSKTVAVVDPSDAALALRVLKEHDWTLSDILVTHRHFDHLLGVAVLKEATGATIRISEIDAKGLTSNLVSLSMMERISLVPVEPDVLLHDGDEFDAAGLHFRVLLTPGHTAGGVSFVCDAERCVFSGDTLFHDSFGRYDLPSGSLSELIRSITEVLFSLPDDYRVYPGHEDPTTIGFERAHNPIRSEADPWFN